MSEHSFGGFSPVKRRLKPYLFDLNDEGFLTGYTKYSEIAEILGIELSESDKGIHIHEYIDRWKIKDETIGLIKKGYQGIISHTEPYFEVESDTPFSRKDDYPLHIHLSAQMFGKGIRSEIKDESTEAKRGRERNDLKEGLAHLSHDMRPEIMRFGTDIMEAIKNVDDPRTKEILGNLKEGVMVVDDMFSTLMLLARDTYDVRKQEIELYGDVIIPSLSPFFTGLKKKKVDIDYGNSFDEMHLYSDPRLLRLIIGNYFSNTEKYTPKGGRIGWGITENDGENWLNVFNTGDPIPDETIDEIFKPFVRGNDAPKGRETGYGVGLASSSKAARFLGEKIWAEKGRKDGANFFVSIKHKNSDGD